LEATAFTNLLPDVILAYKCHPERSEVSRVPNESCAAATDPLLRSG